MRFRLGIEYEGTDYRGWQFQIGQRTIQGEIERALFIALRQKIPVIGAGRTDSGVHARGQIAHFDYNQEIDPAKVERSLNGILPRDIRITEVVSAGPSFHARYDARLREYCYYITRKPSALLRKFSWFVSYPLDLEAMQLSAQLLLGRKNFKSFSRSDTEVKNFYCTIATAQWTEQDSMLVFTIRADRFLYGMVRAIVGTLVEIGRGMLDRSALPGIIESENRQAAGQAAPAKGLILEKIYY
jgi:tRNA pseudouridine38-40 synthase